MNSYSAVHCYSHVYNKMFVYFFSDLHPDNILLGDRGHIQLTYFSQWSSVEQEVHGKAIDLLYAAPGKYHIHPYWRGTQS